jgi:hypothetical protein
VPLELHACRNCKRLDLLRAGPAQPPAPLKLRFENDFSAREIGRILRFPTPFHVYRRLTLLLAQLRELLRRRGVHGPEP